MKKESRKFTVVDGAKEAQAGCPVVSRRAVIILATLALLAAAAWSGDDAGPVQRSAAQTQPGLLDIDYFPAQYENQGQEVEEHIAAF